MSDSIEGYKEIRRTLENLLPGQRYATRVRAVNEFGIYSPWSEAMEFETDAATSGGAVLIAPNAPSVQPVTNAIMVLMDYTAPNDGISTYTLDHSLDDSTWSTIYVGATPIYVHFVPPGVTHYYRFKVTDTYAQVSPVSPSNSGQSLSEAGFKPYATIVIASPDSSAEGKENADYICDYIDDQVEINAAIASLDNGGEIIFLEGYYECTDSLIFPHSRDVSFRGMTPGLDGWTYIGFYPPTPRAFIDTSAQGNVISLKNLWIDNYPYDDGIIRLDSVIKLSTGFVEQCAFDMDDSNYQYAISVNGKQSVIKENTFYSGGVLLKGSTDGGFTDQASYTWVTNNQFWLSEGDPCVGATGETAFVHVQGNHLQTTGNQSHEADYQIADGWGIYATSGTTVGARPRFWTVTDNVFMGRGVAYFEDGTNIKVSNNHFTPNSNDSYGVYVRHKLAANSIASITVSDNDFENTQIGSCIIEYFGTEVVSDVRVMDNKLSCEIGEAVQLKGKIHSAVVQGNHITAHGDADGIYLINGVRNSFIMGNKTSALGGSSTTSGVALRIASADCLENLVLLNDFSEGVTTSIVDLGTSTNFAVGNLLTTGWSPVIVQSLNDLTDVNTTGLTTGYYLGYDGSEWVPSAVSGDKNHVHDQGTGSTTWSVTHGLGKRASVTIVDSSGRIVDGQVDYINDNQVTITFNVSTSGKAYFN